MKTKKSLTHWLSVIVIGVTLGFALQFVRAWTEPTLDPPNGNVGAPINTSDNAQAKGTGNAPIASKPGSIVANDFCLPGGTVCLSTASGTPGTPGAPGAPAPAPAPAPPCQCSGGLNGALYACGSGYTDCVGWNESTHGSFYKYECTESIWVLTYLGAC